MRVTLPVVTRNGRGTRWPPDKRSGHGRDGPAGETAKLFGWLLLGRTMRRLWIALVVGALLVPVVAAQDDAQTRRVQIQLEDEGCPGGEGTFCVRPGRIQVTEEQTLVLEVTNEGQVRHNLTAPPGSPAALQDAVSMDPLAPNETATVELAWETLETAREEAGNRNVTLACGFDGHGDLGEVLTLTVGEPSEQNPQPGFAVWATVAAVAMAGLIQARRRNG